MTQKNNRFANDDIIIPNSPIAGASPKYKNILCVEDEHFISELYSRALEKAGYKVKVISDGGAALDAAKTNEFDIILLDILLPTISGIDLLKQLRSPEFSDLKAKIIVTTNLEQSEKDRAEIEKQADAYLIKADVTPKQLVDFLQSLEK